MSICIIAPNKQSSEVVAAKQMRFELFCECVNGKRRSRLLFRFSICGSVSEIFAIKVERSQQFDRESVPCRWPGHRKVTPADGGPCTWHNECPAVRRPQLPPADDGQDGSADVSQVGRCQTEVDKVATIAVSLPSLLALYKMSNEDCHTAAHRSVC